jgi:hypothetical protein
VRAALEDDYWEPVRGEPRFAALLARVKSAG